MIYLPTHLKPEVINYGNVKKNNKNNNNNNIGL